MDANSSSLLPYNRNATITLLFIYLHQNASKNPFKIPNKQHEIKCGL
jgi:hypothetical protein